MLPRRPGHDKIVKLIVDSGADVRMKDRNDDTALEYAEKNNRTKVKGPESVRRERHRGDPNSLRPSLFLSSGSGARAFAALLVSYRTLASKRCAFWRAYSSPGVHLAATAEQRDQPFVAPPQPRAPRVAYTDYFVQPSHCL